MSMPDFTTGKLATDLNTVADAVDALIAGVGSRKNATADQSAAVNSSTLVSDTTLTCPVTAGMVYSIQGFIIYTASARRGLQVGLRDPDGPARLGGPQVQPVRRARAGHGDEHDRQRQHQRRRRRGRGQLSAHRHHRLVRGHGHGLRDVPVVKASQGTEYVGPQFASWIKGGRAAGLIMGAYHWIEHGNVTAQVDHFLSVLKTVGGPKGLLVQLDCEDSATWADLQEWDRVWSERTGGHPYIIYSGAWWWTAPGRGWPGSTLTPYLWDSRYLQSDTDGIPDDPAKVAAGIPSSSWAPRYGGWKVATILQFTSKGDAGGLKNNVDLNATKLSREQLLALTHPPEDDMPLSQADADLIVHTFFQTSIPGTGGPDHADRVLGVLLNDQQLRAVPTLQAVERIEAALKAAGRHHAGR
jgi:hypothetical protein